MGKCFARLVLILVVKTLSAGQFSMIVELIHCITKNHKELN